MIVNKALLITMDDFQTGLVPKPPTHLMSSIFPSEIIDEISKAFASALSMVNSAITVECPGEDLLAEKFSEVVNQMVLGPIAERSVVADTEPSTLTARRREIKNLPSRATTLAATECAENAASAPAQAAVGGPSFPQPVALAAGVVISADERHGGKMNIVDKVPSYAMRVSPSKHRTNGDGASKYKADAAIFKKDVDIVSGRPNWAHQRMSVAFKCAVTPHDLFRDDFHSGVTEVKSPVVDKWSEIEDHASSRAAKVFKHQQRTAVFSLEVVGSEFRATFWDKSGMVISERADYVESPRTLIEILLGFLILDDRSQGIDRTATLLDKTSAAYEKMTKLAEGEISFKAPVLPFHPDFVLPAEIPTKTVLIVPDNPPAAAVDPTSITSETSSGVAVPPASPNPGATKPIEVTMADDDSFMFEYARDDFKESLAKDWPRYRLNIGGQTFLVGKPVYATSSLIGRGTRAYVTYHEQGDTLVFLKDIWRPIDEAARSEGDILSDLNAQGAKNIPTLLCHGTVDGQMAQMLHLYDLPSEDLQLGDEERQSSAQEPPKSDVQQARGVKRSRTTSNQADVTNVVEHYAHRRIAFKEVCLPLTKFTSSKQLVSVIGDCIEAHRSAVEKCRTMHCDISSENILILPTFVQSQSHPLGTLRIRWRGILADWELSKPILGHGAEDDARQLQRVGTWPFMSVALFLDPPRPVVIADEIESFFHVLLYTALRFLPNTLGSAAPCFIETYFHEYIFSKGGSVVCKDTKIRLVKTGDLTFGMTDILFGLANSRNVTLNNLLACMLDLLMARYTLHTYERRKSAAAMKSVTAPSDDSSPPRPTIRRRLHRRTPSHGPEDGGAERLKLWRDARKALKPAPPSEEDRTKAALLDNHSTVLVLFQDAVTEFPWPENETVTDCLVEEPSQSAFGV